MAPSPLSGPTGTAGSPAAPSASSLQGSGLSDGVWAPAMALAVGSVLGTPGERGRPHRVGTDPWGGVCWETGEATRGDRAAPAGQGRRGSPATGAPAPILSAQRRNLTLLSFSLLSSILLFLRLL